MNPVEFVRNRDGGHIMSNVGADPEAFVRSKKGVWIPAHWSGLPFKQAPVEILAMGKLLRDGYAVEFNPAFAYCRYILAWHFNALLQAVQGRFLKNEESLIPQSAIEIDLDTLEDAPSDVSEFGCEGAWNAYTQSVLKPEIDGPSHPYRYSGGHLHQSFNWGCKVPWFDNMPDVFLWAKLQDRYLGLISTYITGSEWSGLRRQYYGQAGEFRIQEYPKAVAGLEYRTPGSEIWCHPALLSFMLGMFRHIYENFEAYKDHYSPTYENQVKDAINAGVSHEDLLDLIPEMPGWYTKKLLREAKKFFAPIMHQDLFTNWPVGNSNAEFRTRGWAEWCAEKGFTHYRDDYRDNDVRVQRTEGMNSQWEMSESDVITKEAA